MNFQFIKDPLNDAENKITVEFYNYEKTEKPKPKQQFKKPFKYDQNNNQGSKKIICRNEHRKS